MHFMKNTEHNCARPAKTKEIGARLISHLALLSDTSVVLGGDFNQLPSTSAWKELVGHFSFVSPKVVIYLSNGIRSALDHLLFRHPMLDNESASVACHVRWPATRPSQHGALRVASSIASSPADSPMQAVPTECLVHRLGGG